MGVVSEAANAYFRSFTAGRVVKTNSALTFADGMAVRVPDPMALEVIRKGAERVVEVSDDEIAEAIRSIYSATHNCAEGAGAAALAALMKERAKLQGRRAGVILTGQNIDRHGCKPFWRAKRPAYNMRTRPNVRCSPESGHGPALSDPATDLFVQ